MSDKDKELLKSAFAAAVSAVKYACDHKWNDAHLLARACPPITAFDPTDSDEKQWWTEQLAAFAKRLARLPIVECTSQILPAITSEDRPTVDFISPRLLPSSTKDETTVRRMWPLVESARPLLPPREKLADDWTEIADGWSDLGLELNWISVTGLGNIVRRNADTLNDLRLADDPKEWLVRFLDIVGECWSKRAGVELSVLNGMLPNQNGRLCSPADLRQDGGVSDQLKDICATTGFDVRGELLLGGFEEMAIASNLAYVSDALAKAIPTGLSEDDVIEKLVKHLDSKLPEDEDCNKETIELEKASTRLLHYLWESKRPTAADTARRLPLISSAQRAVRWSHDRMMMAPVRTWHESAQQFANAYPPHRVLADLYAGCEDWGAPNVVAALIRWGIAIADPITTDTPVELKERRLAMISSENTEGVVVSGETFSQIALLQPEVLNRCQEGMDEARALLGLVLCHVAPHDPAWQQQRIVRGRRSREDVDVCVRSALWLADLKFRVWVPTPGEDGKPIKSIANATTLRHLLNPMWLENNPAGIKLLSQEFGFDELELLLLGNVPDEKKRQQLRNELAKLVEMAGADIEFYRSLADEVEAKQRRTRDLDRCRRLGLAVQEAVKEAMERYGLSLKLVDKGFDYEVEFLEDTATRFELGPYLLEVKATTTGAASLTPAQAQVADQNSSRYVLCVVDLRGLSAEELDSDWTPTKVEPLAKIVPDIGQKVEETCLWVNEAKISTVPIRNESALRYEVPLSIWQNGLSISDWVLLSSSQLAESQP